MSTGTVTNKWVMFGLSLLTALLGFAVSFDWTTLFSAKTAGIIVAVIGMVKMVTSTMLPHIGSNVTATVTTTTAPIQSS